MRYFVLLSIAIALTMVPTTAHAVLGSFEPADGYGFPFSRDVWSYDAGQTGAAFIPAQYNTGRWIELLGSGNTSDAQYISQHGIGGGAFAAPFALAVRADSPSTNGTFDMTAQYLMGADDLGVAPTTVLSSATIEFDICPGLTQTSTAIDATFNDVPAFSLSFGGTSAAPGVTIGFTDHDSSNLNQTKIYYDNGTTFNSQSVPWTFSRFDHIQVDIDYVNQTFDFYWTKDSNSATKAFDPGNTPQLIVAGASFTSPVTMLDSMFVRTYTDPSDGTEVAHLSKSFLDNHQFSVTPLLVPEPSTVFLASLCSLVLTVMRQRR